MTGREAFAPRVAQVRAALAAHGCAVMLVDHAELLAWLTGYTVSETMYRAALIPCRGNPCFVLRALDAGPCRASVWFDDVVSFADDADSHAAVAEALRSRGFGAARIGVDFASYGFTAATHARLCTLLPEATFVDLGPVSDTLRAVKSEGELALIGHAARIADATMLALQSVMRVGMRVRDVAALAAAELLRHGADDGGPGPILRAKGDNEFLHGQGLDEVLAPGDVLHVELTPRVKNYSARLMRPFVLGARPDLEQVGARMIMLQDRQIAAMRPGAMARDIDAMLRQPMRDGGMRREYSNVTGYMLGLYGRTPRSSDFSHSFHPAAKWRLEAGMVFHMYVSARGLAFSETVLVAEEGGRRLTKLSREAMETCN